METQNAVKSREVNIMLCNYQNVLLNRLLLTVKVGTDLNVCAIFTQMMSYWCVFFPILVIKMNILISGLVKIKFIKWLCQLMINNTSSLSFYSNLTLCSVCVLLCFYWHIYWFDMFIDLSLLLVLFWVRFSRRLISFESRHLKVLCGDENMFFELQRFKLCL